jgi:hypothetical protein
MVVPPDLVGGYADDIDGPGGVEKLDRRKVPVVNLVPETPSAHKGGKLAHGHLALKDHVAGLVPGCERNSIALTADSAVTHDTSLGRTL